MTGAKTTRSDRSRSARLKIWRGTSRDDGAYQKFDIVFEVGDSVLDALVALRRDREPDLPRPRPASTRAFR